MKKKKYFLFIILIQCILCCIAFQYHIESGLNATFSNQFDGFKNNFTLQSFVQEPIGDKGIFYFEFMHYPMGDIVFTADNTPLISVPLRYIHHNIYPVAHYTQSIFTFILLINIILSSCILFKILIRLLPSTNNYLLVSIAILFPWLSDQIFRLAVGHYNLSFSVIIFYSIFLCLEFHDRYVIRKKYEWTIFKMVLITYIAFLAHGYYLAILGVFVGAFLFFYSISNFLQAKNWKFFFIPIVYGLGAVILSYGTIYFTDIYLPMRQTFANGIDAGEQKLTLTNLFTTYSFYSIQFPIKVNINLTFSESLLYLSHFFWIGFLLISLSIIISPKMRSTFLEIHTKAWKNHLFKALFFVGICIFFITLGYRIQTHRTSWEIVNILKGARIQGVIFIIFTTFLLLFILVKLIVNSSENLFYFKKNKKDAKVFIVVTVSLLALLIFLFFQRFKVDIPNVFSPFWYMGKVTRIVEQFRSIGRLFWPVFWLMNLWILIVLVLLYKKENKILQFSIWALFISALMIEVSDRIIFFRNNENINCPNLFSEKNIETLPIIQNIDSFQAILPLPLFEVGSEDYSLTLNDYDAWSRHIMLLAYKNKIPMMAGKLSRTPVDFARYMIELIDKKEIPEGMKTYFKNKKPILIVISKGAADDPTSLLHLVPDIPGNETLKDIFIKQYQFTKDSNVKFLYELDGNEYYEWNICEML